MNHRGNHSRWSRPSLVVLISLLLLALGATAGSLTPPGAVSSTMHSLANIWDSIASTTYDSSAITANQNGSLIGNLKYIENQLAWASSSNNIYSLGTGNVGIGTSTPFTQFQVAGKIPTSAIGSVAVATNPVAIYVQGNYGYVISNGTNTFQIHDVSNANSPALMGSISLEGPALDISVQGRYAYVTTLNTNQLKVIDISNPVAPLVVSTTAVAQNPRAIYVQGRYAYIGTSGNAGFEFEVWDVSNPSAPVSAGGIDATQMTLQPGGVYVQGRYAYMAGSHLTPFLSIIDVTNPGAPVIKSSIGSTLNNHAHGVYVQGRYAYVTSNVNSDFQILDVSNPSSIASVSKTALSGTPRSVYVQGRYAYLTVGNNIQVWDISNPGTPIIFGSFATGSGPRAFVQGRYVYVVNSSSHTLQIFDVGGSYIQQLEAGGVQTGTLTTRGNLDVGNNINVLGGAVIARGAQISGPLSVYASGSSGTIFTSTLNADLALNSRNPLDLTSNDGKFTLRASGSPGVDSFFIRNSVGTKLFTIASLGNVGIGTTTPEQKLEVFGNILASGSFCTPSCSTSLILNSTSNQDSRFTIRSLGFLDGSGATAQLQILGSASQVYMVIASNGYVGIGTTTPGAMLNVVTPGSAPTTIGTTPQIWVGDSFGGLSSLYQIGFGWRNAGFPVLPSSVIGGRVVSVAGSEFTDLFFATRNSTNDIAPSERLTIKASGNIGINTTTPGTTLDIKATGSVDPFNINASASATSLFRITKLGNVGIGTSAPDAKFELIGGTGVTTGSVASISGTSLTTGSLLSLRVPASSTFSGPILVARDTNNLVLASLSSGGRFSLRRDILSHGAFSGCTGVGTPQSGCLDYAESFPTADPSLSAGELVSVDPAAPSRVIRATPDSSVLGIVSTNPAALIDGNAFKTGASAKASPGSIPIALAGRVPVKFSPENGPLLPGDHLALSSIPGTAMKQTSAGMSVGIALESSGLTPSVMVFVRTSYWAPDVSQILMGEEIMSESENLFSTLVQKFATLFHIIFQDGLVQTIRGVFSEIKTDKLCVGITCVDEQQLQQILENNNLQPSQGSATPSVSPSPTPSSTSDVTPSPSDTPSPTETPVPTPTPDPLIP